MNSIRRIEAAKLIATGSTPQEAYELVCARRLPGRRKLSRNRRANRRLTTELETK